MSDKLPNWYKKALKFLAVCRKCTNFGVLNNYYSQKALKVVRYILILVLPLIVGTRALASSTASGLESLRQRCERERSLSSYETLDSLASHLNRQALQAGDKRQQAFATFYMATARVFTGQGKEAQPLIDKAWRLSREIHNDSVGALVMNIRGVYQAMYLSNSFLAQRYFFESLDLAKAAHYEKMKIRIYGNLLILSKSTDDKQMFDYARAIYRYGRMHGDFEQTYMGAYYLALYYKLNRRYREARLYVDEALALYRRRPYEDVASVYVLSSEIMMETGNLSKARQQAAEAIEMTQRWNQRSLMPDAYLQMAYVDHKEGRYEESNQHAMQAARLSRVSDLSCRIGDCYQLIASNYVRMGKKDEAIDYLMKANHRLDTLCSVNMQRLMHERSMLDNIQRKEAQAVAHQQKIEGQRKMLLTLGGVACALAAVLIVIIGVLRSRNRMIKSIVAQNVRAVGEQRFLQQQIVKLEGRIATASIRPGEEGTETDPPRTSGMKEMGARASGTLTDDDERMAQLYERCCQLMETQKPYHEPHFTRDKLAALLGTNRTYLSTVIMMKGGVNYQQFVNSYRISEAVAILSDRSRLDYPLKQLWSDLGFSSSSTFYKLFQQSVGITPSVYRRQFLKIEEEQRNLDEKE